LFCFIVRFLFGSILFVVGPVLPDTWPDKTDKVKSLIEEED